MLFRKCKCYIILLCVIGICTIHLYLHISWDQSDNELKRPTFNKLPKDTMKQMVPKFSGKRKTVIQEEEKRHTDHMKKPDTFLNILRNNKTSPELTKMLHNIYSAKEGREYRSDDIKNMHSFLNMSRNNMQKAKERSLYLAERRKEIPEQLEIQNVSLSSKGGIDWFGKKKLNPLDSGKNRTHSRQKREDLPSIPHIFHQAWSSSVLPKVLAPWMQSWTKHNPDWEYWFWTPREAEVLIAKHYPEYHTLYTGYPSNQFKLNAMKYFILHKYGGLFPEIDLENLRAVSEIIDEWPSCLLSQEPHEHSYFMNQLKSVGVEKGFIACRPGHPFLDIAMKYLKVSSKHEDYDIATGSIFLNNLLSTYKTFQPPIVAPKYDVRVLDSGYFMPTFQQELEPLIMKKCKHDLKQKLLSVKEESVCMKFAKKDYVNGPLPLSYAVHHWLMRDHKLFKESQNNTVSILKIVPKVIDTMAILKQL